MVAIYCRTLVVTLAYISAFLSSCRNQLRHTLVVLELWITLRNDNDDDYQKYSRLSITRTLRNLNLTLTRTKIDFSWISVIHSL